MNQEKRETQKTLKYTNELFSAESTVQVSKSIEGDILTVKGFASVETVDRSSDFVPATEFNVKSFMAKPVLLYNHKYWVDDKGNEIAIGKPTEMYVAELSLDDDENYAVIDYYSREVKDKFPKDKSPDLKVGDRGLWVIAEVSVKEVSDMVSRGELNAFSWRGLTRVKYVELPDGSEQKVLTDIDLFEVSLVNIPANGQATLSIAKSEGYEYTKTDGFTVQSVMMNKNTFENVDMVSAYLKGHRLDHDKMREDSDSYVSVQRSLQEFDPDSLISLQLTNGVNVVAGHLTSKQAPRGWHAESVNEDVLAHYSDLLSETSQNKEPDMAKNKASRKKSTATVEPEVEAPIVDETAETVETVEEVAETTNETSETAEVAETAKEESPIVEAANEQMDNAEAPQVPEQLEALAAFVSKAATDAISDTFKNTLAPALENIANTLGGVNEAVTSLEEKMFTTTEETEAVVAESIETDTDADTDTEATAETVNTDAVAKSLASLQEQMTAIAKSFPDTVRDEVIEKQAKSKDPNSCFNNLWPFIER